ncbi:MAG: hypothetical protein NT140_03325 [Deltaproteobacteria bacterium]|nr:hypothetical protein [Deltaproteobacteria bacterium]
MNCLKGGYLSGLITAYEKASIAALFNIALMFFEEYADNGIKQARLCDARIESILLDVNEKRRTRSSW